TVSLAAVLCSYPLSCIRLQPVQRGPRVDLQGALGSFVSDVRERLHGVCGFPARLTSKPCYYTAGLSSAASAQVLSGEPVNLSESSSVRPILTQLPAPVARPTRPSFGSQPLAWPPLSQPAGAQSRGGGRDSLGGAGWTQGCGYGSSQECRREEERPSSFSSGVVSSSLSSSPPFARSSGYQAATTLPSFSSSSFSTSFTGFQTAASLTSSSSFSSTSSAFSSLPPPSQTPAIPAPKLVPIFKNKHPSRHVNIALLRAQRRREQLGGVEEKGRVTLPSPSPFAPSGLPSSSSSSSMWPPGPKIPPLPIVPRFAARRPGFCGVAAVRPKANHISSLSPDSRPRKPGLSLSPKPSLDFKSKSSSNPNTSSRPSAVAKEPEKKRKQEPSDPPPQPPQPLAPSDLRSNTEGEVFKLKPKKPRSAVQDVDVEKMARSNQLSKVNSATLLAWLKGRGVAVRAKDRKEELMLKVMGCLAEA
uniref:Uncharacterized protein n=1 Tax=Myripristis murdjan TaxID=586833 RepID=A0A667ZFT8_9TELE